MSLKNKFFSILTVALGIVVFSTFTMAQDTTAPAPEKVEKRAKGGHGFGKDKLDHKVFGGRHGDPGKRGGMMRGLRGINLTDAQKAQVKSIMEANKPDSAIMEEARTIRKAKHDGTITAEQQARFTALKTQAREKVRSMHEQIQAVLTSEQKAQIEAKRQEMKQRFDEHKNMRKQKPAASTTEKPKVS